ncbi:DUF4878 domain-containing protein [Planctomycetota bacterium]|nr:DUF4878 domain-containing protein [Planctomycetota bacterium]
MKTVRKLTVTFALAMIALTFSACGSSYSTPEDLGKAYAASMTDMDVDAMIDCYVESEREGLRAMMEVFKGLADASGKEQEKKTASFVSAKEEKVGDQAFQIITVKHGDSEQTVTAVQVDGNWFLSNAENKKYQDAKMKVAMGGNE